MRILLIKPKQIGDSLVLTPTIVAIKQAYPEAEIWVVVRRECEAILAGSPEITKILLVAPVEKRDRRLGDFWLGLSTLWQVYMTWRKFDYVFELGDGGRGRNIARVATARGGNGFSVKPTDAWAELSAKKAGWRISSFDWQTSHRVEKDFYSVSEFLPLPLPIPPLRFDPSAMEAWGQANVLTDFCVVQVGSRQGFNRWHREGWRDVCRAVLERFSHVVVTCGPDDYEREEAAWIAQQLGSRVISTNGATTWRQMAWLLSRAKLYVGPNTAAMHLAAACRCPIVALFGPSIEDHWYPWQVPYRIVTSHGYVPVTDSVVRYKNVKKRTMAEIQTKDVIQACNELRSEISGQK